MCIFLAKILDNFANKNKKKKIWDALGRFLKHDFLEENKCNFSLSLWLLIILGQTFSYLLCDFACKMVTQDVYSPSLKFIFKLKRLNKKWKRCLVGLPFEILNVIWWQMFNKILCLQRFCWDLPILCILTLLTIKKLH